MQTIDDYIEYLVLGSISLGSLLLSAYLLIPDVLFPILQWAVNDSSRVILFAPIIFLLGIVSNQVSFGLNRIILHKPLFRKMFVNYRHTTLLVYKVRQLKENTKISEEEISVNDVGDTLNWGRHLIFKIGSDEMNRQILRIYYAYRIAYGSFFIGLIPFICSLGGLLFGNLTKSYYLIVCAGTGALVLLSFISARNTVIYLWQNLSYAIEVLLQTEYAKFQDFLLTAQKHEKNSKQSEKAK